jgi:radical SAM superfamily enzyme YgiQ (UPF0313 family)
MNKVLLFNPRSATSKPRIPNSVLQIAASIDGSHEWVIVDGNREADPHTKVLDLLSTGEFRFFGSTVMPGPQLRQAIPLVREVRKRFPHIVNVWGGYFASNQYKAVMRSGWVDFVVNGPGDSTFPQLIEAVLANDLSRLPSIRNLIYPQEGEFVKTPKDALPDLDALPSLPYDKLHQLYPIEGYLGKSFLGRRTIAYHSSFGCPFTCGFCAVVPIYEAKWKGKSAAGIYKDIKHLKETYGGDAIEFHDNNFFVSEKRTTDFARLMLHEKMQWWGEARIDTMDKWKDESLALIREAGCRMIFFGAESGSDEVLRMMDKGGKQTSAQIKSFARRLRQFDIIPEYSFVLGTPAATPELVMAQINADIAFIKEIKDINPDAEIIIYVYSPVPTEGSELFESVRASGFKFPETLEDWLEPQWEKFDLRKNPLTPWLTAEMVDKIRDFETVLNARYPTVSDVRLGSFKRGILRNLSGMRYRQNWYGKPYELKLLQKMWKYRQPEVEGM